MDVTHRASLDCPCAEADILGFNEYRTPTGALL